MLYEVLLELELCCLHVWSCLSQVLIIRISHQTSSWTNPTSKVLFFPFWSFGWNSFSFDNWMILNFYLSVICLLLPLLLSSQKMMINVWKKICALSVNREPPRCSKTFNKWASHCRLFRRIYPNKIQRFLEDASSLSDLQYLAGAEHQSEWISKSKILHLPSSHLKTQDNGRRRCEDQFRHTTGCVFIV